MITSSYWQPKLRARAPDFVNAANCISHAHEHISFITVNQTHQHDTMIDTDILNIKSHFLMLMYTIVNNLSSTII